MQISLRNKIKIKLIWEHKPSQNRNQKEEAKEKEDSQSPNRPTNTQKEGRARVRLVIYDASDRSSRSSRRSFSIFLVLLAATTTTNNDAMPRLKMTRGAARRSQENQSSAEQKGRRCIREETRQVGRTVAKGHNPPETRKTRTSRGRNFRVSVRFFFSSWFWEGIHVAWFSEQDIWTRKYLLILGRRIPLMRCEIKN